MITTLKGAAKISRKYRKENKTVALITGCFDILHLGHIKFFQFAKQKADFLIVGVDSDESVRLSKGLERPINKQEERCKFLDELKCIDFVFRIKEKYKFGFEATPIHRKILNEIRPDYVVMAPNIDRTWKMRRKLIMSLGIKPLLDNRNQLNSTTRIMKLLSRL